MKLPIALCFVAASCVFAGQWSSSTPEGATQSLESLLLPEVTVIPSASGSQLSEESRKDGNWNNSFDTIDSTRFETRHSVSNEVSNRTFSLETNRESRMGDDGGETEQGTANLDPGTAGDPEETATAVAWLRVDPVAALEVIRALPLSERRDELLTQAITEWGERDSRAALGWVRQVLPLALRDRLVGQVALGLSTEDPRAAAELVAGEMQYGADQGRAAVGVVQRWVQSDLAGAAAWVARFPQSCTRQVVLETLLNSWYQRNPTAARDWVGRLDEAGLKAQATKILNRWNRASVP